MASANYPGAPFFEHLSWIFSNIDFWIHFGRPVAHVRFPLAAFSINLGHFGFRFGFILDPFGAKVVRSCAHPSAKISHFGIPQRQFPY